MKKIEPLDEYLSISGHKSGFLMTDGKCVYLYDNLCCDAECLRLVMKSESKEIDANYCEDFLLICAEEKLAAFSKSLKILKISELILLYKIQLSDSELFGTFTGGDLPAGDIRYTDSRISEVYDHFLSVGKQRISRPSNHFWELEKAVESGEVKAICKLFTDGKPIKDNL